MSERCHKNDSKASLKNPQQKISKNLQRQKDVMKMTRKNFKES